MNPVVHVEMPYDKRERMAIFYESAFGWQMQMPGEEMGSPVIANTVETDENGPKTRCAINVEASTRNNPAIRPVSVRGDRRSSRRSLSCFFRHLDGLFVRKTTFRFDLSVQDVPKILFRL
jgi:hypothetical protein